MNTTTVVCEFCHSPSRYIKVTCTKTLTGDIINYSMYKCTGCKQKIYRKVA